MAEVGLEQRPGEIAGLGYERRIGVWSLGGQGVAVQGVPEVHDHEAATLAVEYGSNGDLVHHKAQIVAEAVRRHRVTVLFTAPTAYRAMLAGLSNGASASSLSSLRRCVSAGEALPAETWQAWHAATGIKIIDGIGAT